MKECNSLFGALPTTIFTKMTSLALQHGSINLAQGFPDPELEGPKEMLDRVAAGMTETPNQYAPMTGLGQLRTSLAKHTGEFTGIDICPNTEVLVTVGATEALASAFFGMLNPGDEAIVFCPSYDSYVPVIERAGATCKLIHLRPPGWTFSVDELESLFSEKTKLIVINTPHNPTGKVFSIDELNVISKLCIEYDAYAVLDEVYQFATYPGITHTSLQSLDGMRERSIRIGSAGKTFSFTDFKVGWILGPQALVAACAKAHQFLTFSLNSKLQSSVAYGLDNCKDFYTSLGSVFEKKRHRLQERLEAMGFIVLPAQGTYFLVADFAPIMKQCGRNLNDSEFCIEVTEKAGVTVLPFSAFYPSGSNECLVPKTLVRFVICKTDQKLDDSCNKLQHYIKHL